MTSGRERAPGARIKIGQHAAWAMAVGGMIGGGVYTLAAVILGAAGCLAWLSLALGAAIALATVQSYARLTITTDSEAVPVSVFAQDGHRPLAGVLAWALLVVYILALAVYTFTVGHYLGGALDLDARGMALCELGVVGVLVGLNLRGVESPAGVQIAMVWIQIVVLALLAGVGLYRWNPANVTAGVPAPSIAGVIAATAMSFIAFEGFEMLAYDVREVRRPRYLLRSQLPRAVIAVALIYAFVTMGAASLVGAGGLMQHEDHALGIAGRAAAGTTGMVIVTIAAFASGTSAINATLFSVARLARTSAEQRLLPGWCARCNRHDAPMWSIILIGACAVAVAAVTPLQTLVSIASLGFLALFSLVNVLAFRRLRRKRWVSFTGAVGSGGAAIYLIFHLARSHPVALAALVGVAGLVVLLHVVFTRLRRREPRSA
jgi:amino acid transporter